MTKDIDAIVEELVATFEELAKIRIALRARVAVIHDSYAAQGRLAALEDDPEVSLINDVLERIDSVERRVMRTAND